MPLTPEDVANKQFSSVRLREGYDMEEVDQFLDDVEQEIARLLRENDDLRGRLTAAERAVTEAERKAGDVDRLVADAERKASEAEHQVAEAERKASEAERRAAAAASARPAPAPAPTPAPAPAPTPPKPAPAERPADAAAGILALAQRTADEHVADARNQADKVLGQARTRADALVREAEDKRRQTLGSLERERADIEKRIESLKVFEREYRSRLRTYLEGQLRELDHSVATASTDVAEPSRPAGTPGPAGTSARGEG